MATLGRYQSFAVDNAGNVLASPTVEVRDEATSNLATLFSDRAGAVGISNPFTGGADGLVAFHVTGGAYKIVVTSGLSTLTYRYVPIGTNAERDFLSGNLFLGSGGSSIGNSSDITITHSIIDSPGTSRLTFAGSGAGYYFDTAVVARLDPRSSSAASGDISPDISAADMYIRTALSAAIAINAPTGTPVTGNKLTFRLKDNGTARALTWNSIFRAIDVTIPTTTVISKTMYVSAIYNSTDTKWDVVAVNQEA